MMRNTPVEILGAASRLLKVCGCRVARLRARCEAKLGALSKGTDTAFPANTPAAWERQYLGPPLPAQHVHSETARTLLQLARPADLIL
jgi:hypothetical protein